jgi:hypothetical protein
VHGEPDAGHEETPACAPPPWRSWPGAWPPRARCGRHRAGGRVSGALDPFRGPCHQVPHVALRDPFPASFASCPGRARRRNSSPCPTSSRTRRSTGWWPARRRRGRMRQTVHPLAAGTAAEAARGHRADRGGVRGLPAGPRRPVGRPGHRRDQRRGAHLYLERAFEGPFDVPIYLVDAPQGGEIAGTGCRRSGRLVDLHRARRAALARRRDHGAAIAISGDIQRREIASVVLEELVQAMGLVTDVVSPAYSDSIFSENDNSTTRLRGQDAAALRRHYPRL